MELVCVCGGGGGVDRPFSSDLVCAPGATGPAGDNTELAGEVLRASGCPCAAKLMQRMHT